MQEFKIDVNSKDPILKEKDYGNILLLDFDKDSPFIIHDRYDPTKLNMLSEKGQKLLKILMILSDYTVPIATIGSYGRNMSMEVFEKKLNNLVKEVFKNNYNWLILVTTIEGSLYAKVVNEVIKLREWASSHDKLYFKTTSMLLYDGPIDSKSLKQAKELHFEQLAINLAKAFKSENKAMVQKVLDKHNSYYHYSPEISLYALLLKYKLDETIRTQNNRKEYTPNDWKKILDIVYETVLNPTSLKEYFPSIKNPHISIKYEQDYQENKEFYNGRILLEAAINQLLLEKYCFIMSNPNYINKEGSEMINEEKKELIDYVEKEIMTKGFDWYGNIILDVSKVTTLDDNEIEEVIKSLGLPCGSANNGEYVSITLPKEFLESHQNYMNTYFDVQDRMNDDEMKEFLEYYINMNKEELEEFGYFVLDTSKWNFVDENQVIRIADYLGYDFEYRNDKNDPYYKMFLIFPR